LLDVVLFKLVRLNQIIPLALREHDDLDEDGDQGDRDHLEPVEPHLHHWDEDEVSLGQHRKLTLQEQDGVEGQDHARASPLAPSGVVVVSEEDDKVRNNDASPKGDVSCDPESDLLTVGLHVVRAN